MKLKTLIESGHPEQLASGLKFTEGPVWHPHGYLLFSDIPANRTYKWSEKNGLEVWRQPTGNANGMTLDQQNRLIRCEHSGRQVSRLEADGSLTPLATHYAGARFNSPNDVVVKSDGTIYFTDPPYGIDNLKPDAREQPCNGVYRILSDGTVTLLADDFDRPNGLAFSPDESILYIDDSPRRHIRAFDVQADGSLTNNRIFADMDHPQPGSPDGMKIDVAGNLYVTGATGVWVFEPDGTHLGIIVPPEKPANCAWGDADRKSLYITAQTGLYRVRVKVAGLPLTKQN